jgi:hypothetical protein
MELTGRVIINSLSFSGSDTLTSGWSQYMSGNSSWVYQVKHDNGATIDLVNGELKVADHPYVKGHSLTLEAGKIGMNFYVFEPSAEEGTMTFSISGKGDVTAKNGYSIATDGSHVYTCYVSSIQMADTIKASYSCNGKTCEDSYSIEQYVKYFEEHASEYDQYTIALVRAIADYGHYGQIYLKARNGWTFDPHDGYAEMKTYYSTSFDKDEILTHLPSHAIDYSNSTGIQKISYQLYFSSTITLNIWIRANNGATVNCSGYDAKLQDDGRYHIERKISAQNLDTMLEIAGESEGDFSIKVSPLTYINAILTSDSYNADAKNAVCAFYKYYEAAKAYAGRPQEGN